MYWSSEKFGSIYIAERITRSRYEEISKFIHCIEIEDVPRLPVDRYQHLPIDRLNKVIISILSNLRVIQNIYIYIDSPCSRSR